MANCKDFITVSTSTPQGTPIEIVGVKPILVKENQLGDVTRYTISTEPPEIIVPDKGDDGKSATIKIGTVLSGDTASVVNVGSDIEAILNFILPKGKPGDNGESIKGDTGATPTIKVGSVTVGDTLSITNSGTDSAVVLDFVIPRGEKGTTGDKGVAKGILEYKLATGNLGGSYQNMNNFNQGITVDLGENPSNTIRKVRIRAWLTVANMHNWTTLKLTRSTSNTFGGTLVSQRIKHSEGELYVGQYEISAYVETSDQFIGFTFADAPGGTYSAEGEQYGDYGLEVFILE
jgi:hypothetical protein